MLCCCFILPIIIFSSHSLGAGFLPPNCQASKDFIFMGEQDRNKHKSETGLEFSAITKRYKALCDGRKLSFYLLNDRVRTHYQTLVLAVAERRLESIRTIEFHEPRQYKSPEKWLKHITKVKSPSEVDALTGATLTRQSVLKMTKKVLYLENEYKKSP